MIPLYELFSRDFKECLDYSEDMLYELYESESYGGRCSPRNGYYHGKKWMDVTVAAWREDIKIGNLFKFELYEDPLFPDWWLGRVLSGL